MDTVFVNIAELKSWRSSQGFKSARQVDAVLHHQGISLCYRSVEQRNKAGQEKRIRADHASIISEFLHIPQNTIFSSVPVKVPPNEGSICSWTPSMLYLTLADLRRLSDLHDDIKQSAQSLRRLKGNTPHTAALRAAILCDMQERKALYKQERKKVERYVSEIDDEYIQRIIRLRFLDGLSWCNVAAQCYACKETVQAKAFQYIYARCGRRYGTASKKKGA